MSMCRRFLVSALWYVWNHFFSMLFSHEYIQNSKPLGDLVSVEDGFI